MILTVTQCSIIHKSSKLILGNSLGLCFAPWPIADFLPCVHQLKLQPISISIQQPSGPICYSAELEYCKLQQVWRWGNRRLHLCGQSCTCHLLSIYSKRWRPPPGWLLSRQPGNALSLLILLQTSFKLLCQKIMLTCHLYSARCCLYHQDLELIISHLGNPFPSVIPCRRYPCVKLSLALFKSCKAKGNFF